MLFERFERGVRDDQSGLQDHVGARIEPGDFQVQPTQIAGMLPALGTLIGHQRASLTGAVCSRTTMTEHGAPRAIDSATDPRISRRSPLRPWVPTTITSAPKSLAICLTSSAGSPTRTCTRTRSPSMG